MASRALIQLYKALGGGWSPTPANPIAAVAQEHRHEQHSLRRRCQLRKSSVRSRRASLQGSALAGRARVFAAGCRRVGVFPLQGRIQHAQFQTNRSAGATAGHRISDGKLARSIRWMSAASCPAPSKRYWWTTTTAEQGSGSGATGYRQAADQSRKSRAALRRPPKRRCCRPWRPSRNPRQSGRFGRSPS